MDLIAEAGVGADRGFIGDHAGQVDIVGHRPKARAVPTGRIGDRAICDRPAALVHFGHAGQMAAHDGPFRIGHGHKEIGTGREDWTKKYFMAALLGAPGRQSTSCEPAANW